MRQRVSSLAMSVPRQDMERVKVRRQGSRLIIDGVVYKPADLDKLKGKTAEWQVMVMQELDLMLAKEQYRLEQAGHKARKTEALTPMEVQHARKGYDMITSETEQDFRTWLNNWNGSGATDMETKNQFYHEFRADRIDRGSVRGFMEFVANRSGVEINTVEELNEAFGKLF